jgi:excisionase family DNA binding protein
MGEMVIITSRDELKALLGEIISEVLPAEEPPRPQTDLVGIDGLLAFLAGDDYKTSKSRIYKLTRVRAIPFMKVGSKLLFSKSELMSWLTYKKQDMSVRYFPRE